MESQNGGRKSSVTIGKIILQVKTIHQTCQWKSIEDILQKEKLRNFIETNLKNCKFKISTASSYIYAVKAVIMFIKSNFAFEVSKDINKQCISLIQDIDIWSMELIKK